MGVLLRRPAVGTPRGCEGASNEIGRAGEARGIWELDYSQRQVFRSHFKIKGPPTIFLMMKRRRAQLQYLLLRLDKVSFWSTILGLQVAMIMAGFGLFAAAGEGSTRALSLALDANSLYAGRELACRRRAAACHVVGFAARLAHLLFEIILGAVLVVRLLRSVAKHRFEFASFATIDGVELRIRLASNRPSNCIMPVFKLEWFDLDGSIRPLALTNGGTLALLHDGYVFLRHKRRDDASPFKDPDWRSKLFGIRVAVMGYDEVLAADCSSYRFYLPRDIRDDVAFGKMDTPGTILAHGKRHNAIFVHMDRLDATRPLDLEEGGGGGGGGGGDVLAAAATTRTTTTTTIGVEASPSSSGDVRRVS